MKKKKAVVKKAAPKIKVNNDLIPAHKLDMWLKNKYNVLFSGKHGVGKTSIILDAFKRAGLRYAYFSGATMDPFIDFVGVPVKVKDPKTGKESIELLRPKHLANNDVQAIFIDEYNRTHQKIRNAVMELIQFKTINGKPISKDLRVVWAAVNPNDDEGTYDVDHMDPAQEDRFQIHQEIPYKCSLDFFKSKYGEKGETAVEWWNKLDDKVKDKISPRRLDYAMDIFKNSGDLRDVLPVEASCSQLLQLLKGQGYMAMDPLLNDSEKARDFFADESNYAAYADDVVKIKKYNTLLAAFPPEKIASLVANAKKGLAVRKIIHKEMVKGNTTEFKPVLEAISQASQNNTLVSWASSLLKRSRMASPQAVVEAAVLQTVKADKTVKWTTWAIITALKKVYDQPQVRKAVNSLKKQGKLKKAKNGVSGYKMGSLFAV